MRLVCLIIFFAGLCHGVSKATECTARGKFLNNDAEECRGYTMCLLGGASGFTQYKLTCPISFVFSHLELQCTNATNYQCLPNFVCNATGNFENPLSNDCSSYVACPEGLSGIVMARQVECPSGEVFSPVAGACVRTGYECTVGVTEPITDVPVTTESLTTESVPQNATFNVQASSENGFQLLGSVTVNNAVDVRSHNAVLFALLIFVNVNN